MNSLDDLIRDTLAERAHDVDGLTLTAPTTHPHRAGRWAAVTTAVAVAAAIAVAVVLLAPGRGTPQRATTPTTPTTPPAGMQWVSYHGITLTVPASWQVGAFDCTYPKSDAVVIQPLGAASCPPPDPAAAQGTPTHLEATVVSLLPLFPGQPAGVPTSVGGKPAVRVVSDGRTAGPAYVQYQLPAAGVLLTLTGARRADPEIPAGLRYTPVDALGCAATLDADPVPATIPAGPVGVTDPLRGVLCSYTPAGSGLDPSLTGSRVLTPTDVESLQNALERATPWDDSLRGVGELESLTQVVHLTLRDGSDVQVATRGDGGALAVTDGHHRAAMAENGFSLPVFGGN